jgi:nickel/cobalt transporter (NicO) family protein
MRRPWGLLAAAAMGALVLAISGPAAAASPAAAGSPVRAAPPSARLAPAAGPAAGRAAMAFHPLGDFSVNSYDGLVVTPRQLRIDHVLDLAEIPTAQVRPSFEAEGLPAWAERRCRTAAAAMRVIVAGHPVAVLSNAATARLRPGRAGLRTLRVECRIAADSAGGELIVFRDDGVANTVGWHEVTARGDRMTLVASTVPATSRSGRLTTYPADPLSAPLDQVVAELRVRPGGAPLAGGSTGESIGESAGKSGSVGIPVGVLPPDGLSRAFTDLVTSRRLTPGFAALALLIALALGSLHALAPGHGKTIMAAYAAGHGQRARRDVLTLGLTVTVTHTAGVLMLGLFVASGSALAPASIYPWLGIASGALVAMAGLTLLRRAVRTVRAGHRHGHHHHPHGHHHSHGPDHGYGHEHGHGHGHELPRRGGAALMGFAGGLVPSPSAVLVLVGAAAIGQAWFGVGLVLAYGAGLALTLILVGLLVVGSGRALGRRLTAYRLPRTGRPLLPFQLLQRLQLSLLPVGTATLVVVLGVGLALRNLPTAIG